MSTKRTSDRVTLRQLAKSAVKGAFTSIKGGVTTMPQQIRQAKSMNNNEGYYCVTCTRSRVVCPLCTTKANFLNDIASGNWRALNHVQTVDKSQLSYMNWKAFKMNQHNRSMVLQNIRAGAPLRHVETKVYRCSFAKDWQLKRIADQRRRLCNAIRTFNRKGLRFAPRNKPFWMRHLDDITERRWNKLRHVETMDRTQLPRTGWENWHLRRFDRTSLWSSIQSAQGNLKRAETIDKSKPYVEKDYKWARVVNARSRVLYDVVKFAKNPKFNQTRMQQQEKKFNHTGGMPPTMSKNVEAMQ